MDKKLRAKIVEESVDDLPLEQKIVKLFEKIRDIPFGRIGSREPKDVYEKNMGTCSGKNLLLRELYDEIGLETEDMLTLHRFNDLIWFPTESYPVIQLPSEIKKILTKPIYDFHNYTRIYIEKKWIDVDATFDKPLKKYGFVVNENWDGKSNMNLCVVGTYKIWHCGHEGIEKKKEMTALLPKEMQEDRDFFLKKLTGWIDNLRKKGEI